MFKVIFVLVINSYYGGVDTIDFTTLHQCNTAKAQIANETKGGATLKMTCIEKQVPLKKAKCKIVNDYSFRNHNKGGYSSAQNMDGYPYPVALECIEQ
jgi:hypothetical protein